VGEEWGAMMQKTKIEWAESVWNPTRGCSRVNEACRNCFAERIAARFSKACGFPHNGNIPETFHSYAENTSAGPRWTGKVELTYHKLLEPLRRRKPQVIFVNSMSDLWHEKLNRIDRFRIYGIMAAAHWNTFIVLTKRPKVRLDEFATARFRAEVIQSSYEFTRDYLKGPIRGADYPEPNWPLPYTTNRAPTT